MYDVKVQNIGNWILANQWALMPIFVWDVTWRLLAMWRAVKENQKIWFVLFMIVNSVGLLPIIYLVFVAKEKFWVKKNQVVEVQEAEVVKKKRK